MSEAEKYILFSTGSLLKKQEQKFNTSAPIKTRIIFTYSFILATKISPLPALVTGVLPNKLVPVK